MFAKSSVAFQVLKVVVFTAQLFPENILSQNANLQLRSRGGLSAALSNSQGHGRNTHHKVLRQVDVSKLVISNLPGACECMDYWDCVSNNGHVYSYCGISETEVCCFNKDKDNNAIISSAITTPPLSSSTGNGADDSNSNITVAPSTSSSTLTDIDYFFSLEDEVGDLKRINTKEKATTASSDNVGDLDSSSCGTQDIVWKLDEQAQFKEWPWHVAILESRQDLYICGGVLISNDRVITAAHCVYSYVRRNAPRLKIRLGEYDVSNNNEPEPHFEVAAKQITIFPNFNNATLANDIALIKLANPVNYTTNIRPVCLPTRNRGINPQLSRHANNRCVVTGWGRVSESSPFSIVMKEISVPLWNRKDCEQRLQKNFGSIYRLSDTAICAGERGHDACDGDGGGGLVCFDEQRKQWDLLGIVSFGIGCGRQDTPGVYTNIASYLNWIHFGDSNTTVSSHAF